MQSFYIFAVFSTFLNSNSTGNLRATGLSVEDCCVSLSLNKVNLFIYFIYLFIYLFIFIIYTIQLAGLGNWLRKVWDAN